LKLFCVSNKYLGDKEWVGTYNFAFICKKWKGTPKANEPKKCEEVKWFNINDLPKDIIDDRLAMIKAIKTKKSFYLCNWNKR
jgi:hypothetical protein